MIAGSVIATTPAERGQDFFYDPSRGAGLSEAGGLASLGNTLGLLLDTGGGFRAFFTGTQLQHDGAAVDANGCARPRTTSGSRPST